MQATERLPESRKLELNAYLTKPTTRLARYPLLLEAVLKHTPEDSPDKTILPQVITLVREFLGKVNEETGKTENRFNLLELDQQLVFKPGEKVVRCWGGLTLTFLVMRLNICAGSTIERGRSGADLQGPVEQAWRWRSGWGCWRFARLSVRSRAADGEATKDEA